MIKFKKAFFRFLKIFIILAHHGVLNVFLKKKKHIFLSLFVFICGGRKKNPNISVALEALGPAAIKVGQFLATRGDILSPALHKDLQKLQDKVPPFDQKIAIDMIEKEWGCKIDSVFLDVSQPIAAASIAQVHIATLRQSEKKVAIKILRPNIRILFNKDIEAFKIAAKWIHFLRPRLRRLKLPEVIHVFEQWVEYELDLTMEAASMSEYRIQMKGNKNIIVPKIYWEHSTKSVLTMQYISGTPLTDIDSLKKKNFDLSKISANLMNLFLSDATEYGFFHGDLHQGNIMIMEDQKIALLDFGVMGRLDKDARGYLARILYGFAVRDYHSIAKLHFEAGYVPKDQDVYRFAQSLRAIGEPLFDKSVGEVAMSRVLSALFSVTERFQMQTRPELVLLQKNMVCVEGVCGALDPDINIWVTARPLLEKWIRRNFSTVKKIEEIFSKILHKIERSLGDH